MPLDILAVSDTKVFDLVIYMACYHPLKAIQYKTMFTEKGKRQIRLLRKEEYDKEFSDDVELLSLPCGQCIGCRMDYARQWANRLMLELESFKNDPDHTGNAYFVTLTIADSHIGDIGTSGSYGRGDQKQLHVRRPYADPDSGLLLGWSHSLSKVDLQLFLKRLRKYHPNDKIRFFACGEYGSKKARPHYHLIIFGLSLDDDDLTFYEKSKLGYDYMQSKYIEKCWPFGMNIVAPVTWESCCYVARYMMKKALGPEAKERIYDRFNLQEPYTVMSRRPGIGNQYYKDHPISVDTTSIVLGTSSGSRKFPPPRYLERLFEFDDPEGSEKRKQVRRLSAINRQNMVLKETDVDAETYLHNQELKFQKACSLLSEYRFLD